MRRVPDGYILYHPSPASYPPVQPLLLICLRCGALVPLTYVHVHNPTHPDPTPEEPTDA